MANFGERIRDVRNKQQLTVRVFAERVGLSPGYISRIEGRGEIPTPEVICRMSSVLGVMAEELLELAKAEMVERTTQEITQKQAEALRLFRKKK